MLPSIHELEKNFHQYTDAAGHQLFFSYATCVAFSIGDHAAVLDLPSFSRTTRSHIKRLLPDAPRISTNPDFLRHVQIAIADSGADIKFVADEPPSIEISNKYKCITDPLGTRIGISYSTIIGYQVQGDGPVVRANSFGPTTGKHINDFKGGPLARATTLTGDEFERSAAQHLRADPLHAGPRP